MHIRFIPKIFILLGLLVCFNRGLLADEPPATHPLLSAQLTKLADDYYRDNIKANTSAAKTTLERVERKVHAKQAFDSQDWYGSRYGFVRVLADSDKDFQAWYLLCKTLIALQEYDSYQNYDDALQAALSKAYQNATSTLDKAAVDWLASQTKFAFKELREAALKLASQNDIESHVNKLISNYPQEFAPYHLDIPQRTDVASACISWTASLVKTRHFHYEEFISLEPKVKDLGVIAKGKQLCLEGLTFGQNYQLTFKNGFPSEAGTKLTQAQSLGIYVPHRKAAIRFREKGYILASGAPQVIPFVAVNVAQVKVKVIHIPERNIQSVENIWFNNQITRWDSDRLQNEQGQVVWEGTYRFPIETDKTAISGLPIDAMMGRKLQPGVYVIEARMNEESYDENEFASQALVISDIGMSSYLGPDGLHVFTRSLSTAKVFPGASIHLIARNNRELAKTTTDQKGQATFSAQLLNGKGGNRPAFLTASIEGKQFTLLSLKNEAFDLSDRGVDGRAPAGPVEAYLYTERGIYRPGETVHHLCLLRDNKGQAITKLPITLKIMRPDGVITQESVLQDAGNGSYALDYTINSAAQTGVWTAAIYTDPKANELSRTSFEVNDFVPPRIEVKTSSSVPSIAPHQSNSLAVQATYYFGPPGANLKVTSESQLTIMQSPFAKWKDYQFGLIEEQWTQQRFKHLDTQTDEQGKAAITTKIDLEPETTHPLQLETTATVYEVGGRGQSSKNITAFWHQPYLIGIAEQFKDNIANSNSDASFNIIAVNQQGELQSTGKLRYTLYEEQHDYVWFRSGVNWQYEVITRDQVLASGTLQLEGKSPTPFKVPVKYGSYRLEILDEKSGVASSVRFAAGWFYSADAPDRPDMLEMAFSEEPSASESKASVFIKSPFAGDIFLAWAGDSFKPVYTGKIGTDGLKISVPVNKTLNSVSGDYLIATVYRPGDEQTSQLPKRAIGVAWFENPQTSKKHQIKLILEHPEVSNGAKTVEVVVKPEKPQQQLQVAVALVDEGTLSLTEFESPNPFEYFFSQKRLAYELRDSYGYLINPYGAKPGSFEVGGGESVLNGALTRLPARTYKVVSLFSGIVAAKDKQPIRIPFDIPEYSGKLRVMAVAWNENGVGQAQSYITVRDDIDVYLSLPRFIAPQDTATVPLILKNISGPEGEYQVTLRSDKQESIQKVTLKKGEELRLPFTLQYNDNGIKKVEVLLKGPQNFQYKRQWELDARPTTQPISLQQYGKIDPKSTLTLTSDLLDNFRENSQVVLSIGSLPELGSAQLIQDLLKYPYHCLEQTTSRLLATLYSDKVTDESLQKGFNQLTTLQKIDGSFSLWGQNGYTEPWLTLYAADMLYIAQEKGFTVPQALTLNLKRWTSEAVQRNIGEPADVGIIAFAHYLQAKQSQGSLRSLRFFTDNQAKSIKDKDDLAFIAAAFAHYGDAQNATLWFDKAIQAPASDSREYYVGFGSALRDEAILVALMAETTHDSVKILPLAKQLVDKASLSPYLSTQEKAWLIRADAALKDSRKAYHLVVNGNEISGLAPTEHVFSDSELKKSPVIENKGDLPVYYARALVGEPKDVTKLAQGGFELQKSVYTLDGQTVDLANLKSGELYVVQIKGRRLNNQLHHILLVDRLPAGLEIEKATLSAEESLSWLDTRTRTSRQEGRDDRFVAAFEFASQNEFSIAYMVRAVTPGNFTYPASFIEAMYQPRFFVYTQEQKLQVHSD
ncbi:alpha-2-macroglobulin family protein [Candidatus Berkiella aquae]|uniref:Alpha-2-macroglobulin family protein n=1 Tax=Candidatus Berkiella aquae TaxID=295108 RepID=A0AAE3HWG2_9GAMM|nr:alpha-2-macroglobulin [Candidatus Berkiella aquae]MCS5711325.1 alpha-2-macroglobulin family protein [Candidatus Berkiella aquae]